MKLASLNLTLFFLAVSSLSVFGESKPVEEIKGTTKVHANLYDWLTSNDFDCEVTSKRIFKPGTTANNFDLAKVTPVCTIITSCEPHPGVESATRVYSHSCLGTDGVCEDPMVCAIRRKDESSQKKYTGGRIANVASTAIAANNTFEDICWETNGIKDKRGVIQLLSEGKPVEEFCSIVYACRGSKKPKHGSCALRKEGNEYVCPQLNDCINEDLSFIGHSKSELEVMSSREVDEYFAKYEAGKKPGQLRTGNVTRAGNSNRAATTHNSTVGIKK